MRVHIAHVSREAHDTAGGAPALPDPEKSPRHHSPQPRLNAMTTAHDIHNDIEPWLAASVHGELSEEERQSFQEHLAECADCRALHEQEIAMNNIITSTLETAKPDLAFEQRVVSGFRKKVPQRAGLIYLLTSLVRFRATQIAVVAAVMLTLVSIGHWLTDAGAYLGNEELAAPARGTLQEMRMRAALGNAEVDSLQQRATRYAQNVPSSEPSGQLAKVVPPAAAPAETAPGKVAAAENSLIAPADKDHQEKLPITVYSRPSPKMGGADLDASLGYAPNETSASENYKQQPRAVLDAQGAGAASIATDTASNRKLVRNAQVELEVIKFDEAVQKITAFVTEMRGYVATSSSEKQANGKLRGEVVVKVLPETFDAFLLKLRGLGEVKNQTLGTEDVTKQYFDTDSRLKNARVMEQRLIDILKTKSSKVADLLEVEKELGRVRSEIEQMQGELKYMDAQVAFATVTITLAEKEMNVPAAFLLKRRAQLALFSTDVEKTFVEVKSVVDGTKAQISSSNLERDSTGEATARLMLLIAPEEADALIARIKGMGRVQNYNEQTERVAQGGSGMAEGAKVERDKVELSITISRNEQEPALQTTSLRILTGEVTEKVAQLKANAAKAGAEIRSSSFSRNPDGQEFANVSLRLPMKNYPALMSSFDQLGKVKDVSVLRDDRRGTVDEATAPADINIQVYTQADIVSDESGLFATVRRTLMQGASALMWSLRMIGVALAFLAPWVVAIAVLVWIVNRVVRARKARQHPND